jgi:hypothetical protein
MNQMYFPGMEPKPDTEEQARKERLREKVYRCRECRHAEPSVVWVADMDSFICWACGEIDVKRSKEAR